MKAVRERLERGLRAALTADCAQVLAADLRAYINNAEGLRMREVLWSSADAGWRELIAVLDADGKPEGAAVDYVRTIIRERDEARAALALAYPRALQAAADVVREHPREDAFFEHVRDGLLEEIIAMTPEDIERIAKEHEHG